MARGSECIFVQRGYTNGQQIHEKMLNITGYQGNENQNQDEVPLHTHEDNCN